jgi:hypothetical protein
LLAVLLATATGIASAQTPAPRFDAARLSDHIRTLSSDAFEGRGPATSGEKKAIDYIVGQFRAAGLQPAGDFVGGKRGWTQAVPLVKSDLVGAPKIALNLAGGAPAMLAQGEDIALRSPMNGASSISLDKAPLLFAG